MREIRASARDIAETLFSSGDLATERQLLIRAQEGMEIHQYWQGRYLPTDQKEVSLGKTFDTEKFHVEITGRADGIIVREGETYLEEIKSTHADFELLDETTIPAHLVQAKIYAYLYALQNNVKSIWVRLTYIRVVDRETKSIDKLFTFKRLETFFDKTITEYLAWIEKIDAHEVARQKSIGGLSFPFPEFRLGQRDLMGHVYRNILDKGILYATAPTGIGKTIATLFSALKAINDYRQKIFYLTAKNDGKKVAIATISLMEKSGLIAKSCEITAKDSACLLKVRDCDPEVCKYAKGYYNRIYKAIDDIYSTESLLTKDRIREYAKKHRVCPFEYSLDLSNYADIVISDYNYAFDPGAHLIRYFEDDAYQPILLVDEAHNLVSRSRDMYSSTLFQSDFESMLDFSSGVKPAIKSDLKRIITFFEEQGAELLEVDFVKKDTQSEFLVELLKRLMHKIEQALAGETKIPHKSKVMDLYVKAYQYVKISAFYDDDSVFLLERIQEDTSVSIKCLDASKHILETIKQHAVACVFFSATLEPMHYYKTLLTQSEGKDVKLPSSFPQKNLCLLGVDSISTRYNDRSDSLAEVIEIAEALVGGKKGNYILFFPSYQYLMMVKDNLELDPEEVDLIIQKKEMSLKEREAYLSRFEIPADKSQVGLFVMGGIFGESLDLIGDMLSGVLIVGVGLPMLSPFNNILRSHFDEHFDSGFDFAYTYPGLNKVIQAVGRVIRTETDRGVAILVDDRFSSSRYKSLYPREWSHLKFINDPATIAKTIRKFWKEGQEHDPKAL